MKKKNARKKSEFFLAPCDHSDGERKALIGTNTFDRKSPNGISLKKYHFPGRAGIDLQIGKKKFENSFFQKKACFFLGLKQYRLGYIWTGNPCTIQFISSTSLSTQGTIYLYIIINLPFVLTVTQLSPVLSRPWLHSRVGLSYWSGRLHSHLVILIWVHFRQASAKKFYVLALLYVTLN